MVLYQLGDFFELYGEDAKIAFAALDLNLTTREFLVWGVWSCAGFLRTHWNSMRKRCEAAMM
ncbi:MAG: hypothetical protein LIO57_09175 [Oscillospiraceae bacterium]|nr:hypothetical protein [Oscillospiraceae bacterium]